MFLLHRGEFEYRVQWIRVQFTLIIVNPLFDALFVSVSLHFVEYMNVNIY